MEKIKVDFNTREPNHYTIKVGDDGYITVVDFIPYEKKEQMAFDIVTATLQTDDDLGMCYSVYTEEIIEMYYLIRYYTNIDTGDATPEQVYDWVMSNHIKKELIDNIGADYWEVDNLVCYISDIIISKYKKENSLEHQVKLLLNTDPNVNNEETRELLEKLIDMKGALIEKENNVIALGTKKATSPKTGGVKINLSKKDNN